jgi:hypothetical protein
MKRDIIERVFSLLPTPILNLFGFSIDKSGREYSRGDFLYGQGFGGYRVTSHVGDGLATFGYLYFPLQFVVLFFVFLLLNSLVFFTKIGVLYSPFGLINVFTFLGMFRNANGITMDLSYCLRGFWQGCFTYLILFQVVKQIVLFKKRFNVN